MTNLSVLISCLNFKNFTGSELYVYELALALKKAGCDVTIMSRLGGPLTQKALKKGLRMFSFEQPPIDSIFDIIHSQHFPVTRDCLRVWPATPHICSIHSEIIEMEKPVIDTRIKKYIAVRPTIKQHLCENYAIPEEQVTVIKNPIDGSRFNKINTRNDGFILFVGTIDYLRERAIRDLVQTTQATGQDLLLVGMNKSSYLESLLSYQHVKYLLATEDVERITKKCAATAGIMLGRTTVEGWLCGKPSLVYDVDEKGNIISKSVQSPPDDVVDYLSDNVVRDIMRVYREAGR